MKPVPIKRESRLFRAKHGNVRFSSCSQSIVMPNLTTLDDEGDTATGAQMSRSVREKLWTVYRPSRRCCRCFGPSTPDQLQEPPEITQALDSGSIKFSCPDHKDFRSQIGKYLDSQHRYWPIVESVSIRGPFDALGDGAKIMDLPGLNDPNEAREAVTKSHLKTCTYVWIVFQIRRALNKRCYRIDAVG